MILFFLVKNYFIISLRKSSALYTYVYIILFLDGKNNIWKNYFIY